MKFRERIFILLICVVLFFFACNRLFILNPGIGEQIVSYVTYPVVLFQCYTVDPCKNLWNNLKTYKQLEDEVKTLKQRYLETLEENVSLKGVVNYFDEIDEILSFKKKYSQKDAKICQIIYRMISDRGHVIFVDSGSKNGIDVDMVAVYRNCLIGRVEQVYPFYSRIICTTDSRCKVAACCVKTKTRGICVGGNRKDRISLEFVEHFNKLKTGELVLSDGGGLVFPKGFCLGKISNFEKKGISFSVDVEPAIEIESISYCYLIKKGE